MTRVPSHGPHAEVTHPTSGRTIRLEVLDEFGFIPGPNLLPEIRIPVRRAPEWLESQFDNNPTLDVYLDGQQLPIDELVDVEHPQGRTVLVGEGGVELRQRVQTEVRSEQRHTHAENLISNNTPYATDFDTPSFDTLTGQEQQSPTTTSDFDEKVDFGDTDPVDTSGDQVTVHDTSFTQEAENNSGDGTNQGFASDTSYSGGSAAILGTSDPQKYVWYFTPGYTIPAEDFDVGVRINGDSDPPAVSWKLNDEEISTYGPQTTGDVWEEEIIEGTPGGSAPSSDLSENTQQKLTVEVTTQNTGSVDVDVFQPHDTGDRYSSSFGPFNYTYDNTVHQDNGALDGPGIKPPSFHLNSIDSRSAFSYTKATADITINDTPTGQRLQVSNDRGSNWFPSDGTEDKTSSVTHDFASGGSFLRLRIDFPSYSPNGTRNQTPRENYDSPVVSDWTLTADVQLELLLIDWKRDEALVDILNDIAGEQFTWAVRNVNGTTTIEWTQHGERTATREPELSDATIRKRGSTWSQVVINGSDVGVAQEQFTSDHGVFVDLVESKLLTGSEVIYDAGSGTQYGRGVDYEMDYSGGRVRVLANGDMADSTVFNADYQHEVQGVHTVSGAPATPDELVRDIPGIVNDRQAEQIGFALAEVDPAVESPRYDATIVIPEVGPEFNPVEAFELPDTDLPPAAGALSIRGDPQITPRGVQVQLGSAPTLDASLGALRDQVSRVTKRS